MAKVQEQLLSPPVYLPQTTLRFAPIRVEGGGAGGADSGNFLRSQRLGSGVRPCMNMQIARKMERVYFFLSVGNVDGTAALNGRDTPAQFATAPVLPVILSSRAFRQRQFVLCNLDQPLSCTLPHRVSCRWFPTGSISNKAYSRYKYPDRSPRVFSASVLRDLVRYRYNQPDRIRCRLRSRYTHAD